MSKENIYELGETQVTCDGNNCSSEITIEGFDGHCLPYSEVNKELKEVGWTTKKENGDWIDLCSGCSDLHTDEK